MGWDVEISSGDGQQVGQQSNRKRPSMVTSLREVLSYSQAKIAFGGVVQAARMRMRTFEKLYVGIADQLDRWCTGQSCDVAVVVVIIWTYCGLANVAEARPPGSRWLLTH
jgi:hypothetical protein|mmetsp:Transcript_31853/g.98400  ORF Transcript_31853/g.98400 Transcript_31853/m.98400 type:complete len:110 (+) Transcript_31853:2413-2742(+)